MNHQNQKKRAPRPQYSPEYEIFVRHLRATIQKTSVTQTELADRLQKPQSYVSKILAGYQALTVAETWKLLDAAGVSFTHWAAELDKELNKHCGKR